MRPQQKIVLALSQLRSPQLRATDHARRSTPTSLRIAGKLRTEIAAQFTQHAVNMIRGVTGGVGLRIHEFDK